MANPKTGLAYYNVDTDRYQDIRIKRLKKSFSCQGIAVYDYILCEIYRVRGCFLEWDDSTAFDVAEYFGLKESLVSEIVKYCASVGLYNKELLGSGIITSRAIQQRYLDFCNRAKRKSCTIPEKIRLLEIPEESDIVPEESDIVPEESDIVPEESDIVTKNSGRMPRSKVKYSKEKDKPSPSIVSPSLYQGGETGGGRDIFSLLSSENINRADILEACRLSEEETGYAENLFRTWAAYDSATKLSYPFSGVIEYLQQFEKQGRLHPPSEEEFTVRRWLKNNLTTTDSAQILNLLTTQERFRDCLRLIDEIKKGRINCPAQFLLKRLQK